MGDRLFSRWTLSGLLGAGIALSACATSAPPDPAVVAARAPAEIVEGCCERAGDYPDWVLQAADDVSDVVRVVGKVQFRSGHLVHQPQALDLIERTLKPLDLVFASSRNRVSGLLIPGQFTHGAIYLGTEAQLRDAGIWQVPELVPYHDRIRAGATYLEAVDGGVRLTTADVVLDTDAAVVLRPPAATRADALARGVSRMGVPFDMRFDAADPSALFCAELIALMFPDADVPRIDVPGRETIVIDGIVAGVLADDLPFSWVGYVKATAFGGARSLSAAHMAWDMAQQWEG